MECFGFPGLGEGGGDLLRRGAGRWQAGVSIPGDEVN